MRATESLQKVLKPFVREALGCACPERVFDDIRIERAAIGCADGWLIGIGGRLLLMIVEASDWQQGAEATHAVLQQGRALRDARGYNRFRLVLPSVPGEAGAAVTAPATADLMDSDGRLHLHLLPAQRLATVRRRLREAGD